MKELKKGFTIIELTIYIGLMSVLILVISRIFISSLDSQIESKSVSSVQQDGRFIIAKLSHDIALADSIITPASPGAQTTTLVLQTAGQNTQYSLSGNNLIYTTSLGQDRLNSTTVSVENITFLRIGNPGGKNTISVDLVLESLTNTGSTGERQNFQTTIGTR